MGSLLKFVAYRAAPEATLAVLHPRAALRAGRRRRRMSVGPRAVAIGVAAIVLPVGMAVGRRMERERLRFMPSDVGRVPRLRVAGGDPRGGFIGAQRGGAMRRGA